MTQSMTAFARVQAQFNDVHLCWEIKSVNHRYLELSFRMPESLRFLETELRAAVRGQLARGKVECQLKISDQSANNQSININQPLMNALLKAAAELAASKHLANDLTVSGILNWPGMVETAQADVGQLAEHVLLHFKDSLQQLQIVRTQEGNALQVHIEQRLTQLNEEINHARKLAVDYAALAQDKLLTRLHGLQLNVDNVRIEQEIALLLTKLDVTEELDRLTTHVHEVAKILKNPEASGRRLDFLMQELNREANTISSKSDSSALTKVAVEMKVLIEQMREQIQNIE